MLVVLELWLYYQLVLTMQTTTSTSPAPTGIADAVQHVNTQERLAGLLGVSQQAVSIWLRRGWVPLRRSQEIEALTGVPRARLINPRIADMLDLPEAAA